MTVAPLIAMKSSQVKSFDAVGRELDRRAHTYANDVDQSGRHIGYRCRAKELFAPDKRRKNAEGKWEVTAQGTMSRLQEDFWEQVAKPYGYERPMRHELRAKGYRSLDAYKVQVGTTRALKRDLAALERDYGEDDDRSHKGAQTRFGGLGARLRGRR